MCKVEGKTEFEMRMSGINLSGGHTNSLEICQGMFDLPDMWSVLDIYNKEKEAVIEI